MEALVWSGPSALTLSVSNWINCCVPRILLSSWSSLLLLTEETEKQRSCVRMARPMKRILNARLTRKLAPTELAPSVSSCSILMPLPGHSLWRWFFRRRRRVRLFLDEQFPERLERVKRKSERLGNVERFLLR